MADASLAELPLQVALALSMASSTTGADYDYLLKTAQRESGFQAEAKAPTSSATGLFQFIEETWIRTVKEEGDQYGLGEYTKLIAKTDSGRYYVPDANDRERILALRKDPHIAAMMAGAFARRNELVPTRIKYKLGNLLKSLPWDVGVKVGGAPYELFFARGTELPTNVPYVFEPPTEEEMKDWEGDLDEFLSMTVEESHAISRDLAAEKAKAGRRRK